MCDNLVRNPHDASSKSNCLYLVLYLSLGAFSRSPFNLMRKVVACLPKNECDERKRNALKSDGGGGAVCAFVERRH